MAKFRFRLEASLKLAENDLDNAKKLLAEEMRKLQACEERTAEQKRIWEDALRGQQEAGINQPGEISLWQMYAQRQALKLRQYEEELSLQQKKVEQARQELLVAYQEAEKFKRLKEKQKKDFLLIEQRKEQKLLDEAGQNIFLRQQNRG